MKKSLAFVVCLMILLGALPLYASASTAAEELLTAEGAQVRTTGDTLPKGEGTAALRFLFSVACQGVVNRDGLADYSAATVVVDGRSCAVTDVGALVAREEAVYGSGFMPEEVMQWERPYGLCSRVNARRLYAVYTDGDVLFSVVVNDIPAKRYTDNLCVRPYVQYIGPDGQAHTAYGQVITRNVYDVWHSVPGSGREPASRADYLTPGEGYFAKDSRVVFLGDSITRNTRFPAEISRYYAARYPEDRVEMYMAAIRGGTVVDTLTYLEEEVMAYAPDYVSIMLGMNDIGRTGYTDGFSSASAEVHAKIALYGRRLRQLVETLQDRGVQVILCTPTPYDDTSTVDQVNYLGSGEAIRRCAEYVRRLAALLDCHLVEFNTPFTQALAYVQNPANGGDTNYSVVGADRVHPGTLGHDYMARLYLQSIGESVPVPTNAKLLACIKKEASINTNFEDMGLAFSRAVKAVDTAAITGTANHQVCLYWEAEHLYIPHEKYGLLTLDEKIELVASQAHLFLDTWRGQECNPTFPHNARWLKINQSTNMRLAAAVYK